MARTAQPSQQFESVHSGQIGIDHQTCFAARPIGFEELLTSRVILHDPAIFLQHAADSIADASVVIDDEDRWWHGAASYLSMFRRMHACSGLRYREKTLDGLVKFLEVHRFGELETAL